jgi:hypothetical protein
MPNPETEKERDLATILEDVKTIKAILQNQDAPLPPVWRLIYFVGFPALVLVAGLKFFVPALAAMSFLDTVLWLWAPVFAVAAIIISFRVSAYLKKTGTRFMAQGRVQIFLYTRLILAPGIITAGYLLSLNAQYSLDGAMAVLAAVGVTQVIALLPRQFKFIPFIFLFGGWIELGLNLRGPIWTLVNTLSIAATVFIVATVIERAESHPEGR